MEKTRSNGKIYVAASQKGKGSKQGRQLYRLFLHHLGVYCNGQKTMLALIFCTYKDNMHARSLPVFVCPLPPTLGQWMMWVWNENTADWNMRTREMVGWETTKRARLKPTLTAWIFIPPRTITYSFYSENCDTLIIIWRVLPQAQAEKLFLLLYNH